VPIVVNGALAGVLDVDAPETNRFDDADRAGLEAFVEALAPRVRWEGL
jgi:GAF domain-containing protein